MRILTWSLTLYILLASCSAEPPALEVSAATGPDPVPYLYKLPTTTATGLAVARVKKEALAEAFVTRLSAKAPAGVVVMQHEKLVLEEYFGSDSTSFICTGALFPAYTAALLGTLYADKSAVPNKAIPLHVFYPPADQKPLLGKKGYWSDSKIEEEQLLVQQLEALVQEQMATTQGMAAEELLFEPLQIDDYTWQEGSLCMHPHALLQLGSLWLRRGKWGDKQLLPDRLVQHVLEPAYNAATEPGMTKWGWQYYRLMARGRKHPVLYWKNGSGAHLFLLPEVESVVLLQGEKDLIPEDWVWLQDYLIPSLTP